ncbi:MAG TPA: hypothetical protein VM204_06445, partial [Gaiellaceae bacterium]|nr:hypothetical protein [Gaiellaceae bacterium]
MSPNELALSSCAFWSASSAFFVSSSVESPLLLLEPLFEEALFFGASSSLDFATGFGAGAGAGFEAATGFGAGAAATGFGAGAGAGAAAAGFGAGAAAGTATGAKATAGCAGGVVTTG